MKILGREPAAWVGFVEALIVLAVASGLDLTAEQIGLVMAAVTAVLGVYTAYVTHDTVLGGLVGLTKAALALLVGFGLTLDPEFAAAVIGFVMVGGGLFLRTQTSPAVVKSFAVAAVE